MDSKVQRYERDLETVRGELLKKKDFGDLFYKLIVDNRRSILDLKRTRKLTVTAYSPRVGETDDSPFHTASNKRVRQGIVAVSRDLFDAGWVFGKKVYIKNHGLFTIDDLMAARKRNQIDIFMFDTGAATAFGRQILEVHLLDI